MLTDSNEKLKRKYKEFKETTDFLENKYNNIDINVLH
eukprot:CAMPEP_0170552654 /NCGR_PEP_ID=MMETSP0211-20121228/10530_1 /TAXON_ID=311385 /ORGANISM="Pseudokeronopsis sp., Strain OXSARD2" /LENGTH=36 /DNA_ID= /DNA_START= /DNA_END= /DNA_ORIENTATION=